MGRGFPAYVKQDALPQVPDGQDPIRPLVADVTAEFTSWAVEKLKAIDPYLIEHDQTAVMGTYRFLDNKRVSLPALYQPLFLGLQKQIGVGQRAYVLHDVSVVDYSKYERKEDLCSIGDGRGWGYELFSSLVVNEQGQAVGCCNVELRTQDGLYSS